MESTPLQPPRNDGRIIIHFDYDCFYASVFEVENPALKTQPLAVQQKQIIVTCNYVARARGLRKLQLVSEAKDACPDLIIILGEDLTKFRNASKENFLFLESYSWNKKLERLGFDEVFMDVTDIVDYNEGLLNQYALTNSFFHMSPTDPTSGFSFDAGMVAGQSYPDLSPSQADSYTADLSVDDERLLTRLRLGSHLAFHLRKELEHKKGFTSTIGISTNKELSKLAGNIYKPNDQTTLLPPYTSSVEPNTSPINSNVLAFVDAHDIGKIPGIGFKMAQRIREFVLSRPAGFDDGLIWGATKESVTVADVRYYPGMGPSLLDKILAGQGMEHGVGKKVWYLIHGVDDTEVKDFSKFPSQISIEDSYLRLDTLQQVQKELELLATSLVKRMHVDLTQETDGLENDTRDKKWIAFPRTLRLSTRPRLPANADGTRTRSFKRISRSAPLPSFIFNLTRNDEAIVDQLVNEHLMPMFRRLHPEKHGWNLSLLNVCVTNMIESSGEGNTKNMDISHMLQNHGILKPWQVEDRDVPPDGIEDGDSVDHPKHREEMHSPDFDYRTIANEDQHYTGFQQKFDGLDSQSCWGEHDSSDDERDTHISGGVACGTCGTVMPHFAMEAHSRFHELGNT